MKRSESPNSPRLSRASNPLFGSLALRTPKKEKSCGEEVPLVDVTQFVYFKVLGKGVLPEGKPIVMKAKLVLKIAEKKIKAKGNTMVLTA
ncbi:hypothetical protein Drorol1_Dr00004910 [Drosera rotundifolia]